MGRELYSVTLYSVNCTVWHVDQTSECPYPLERIDILSLGTVGYDGLEKRSESHGSPSSVGLSYVLGL